LGPGFIGAFDENRRRYFRWISARCKRNSVDGLTTIAERIKRPGRMKTAHQTGDHAIRGAEIGRSFSRTVEDQQLVLNEHGFAHHRAGTAGTGESGNGHQQMQKPDRQIAHRRILPRSRHGQRVLTNLEFAMDT
jgi:hypothetical protein